ncbi:MAG: hypothetical protein HY562_06325, partial [Ignavibacteriales bacterium]|nr:hypothetical protein [Ignavibacteriales bacterium]
MKHAIIAFVLILAAALSRLIPHPPNFAPIAAMALAGGVYLDKRFAIIVPLAALLLSDAIIGFHSLMVFVYGSFLAISFIGLWLKSHKKPLPVFGAALASSCLFFVVSNFGVWLLADGSIYPRSIAGILECYIAAVPFFQNTVLGDVLYTGVMFGILELVNKLVPVTAGKQTVVTK